MKNIFIRRENKISKSLVMDGYTSRFSTFFPVSREDKAGAKNFSHFFYIKFHYASFTNISNAPSFYCMKLFQKKLIYGFFHEITSNPPKLQPHYPFLKNPPQREFPSTIWTRKVFADSFYSFIYFIVEINYSPGFKWRNRAHAFSRMLWS